MTNAAPADAFEPEDREMLRAYVCGAAQLRRAAESIAAGDKDPHHLRLLATAAMTMARMAQRLRLGPRGRRPNGTRQSGKAAPSAYDLLDDGDTSPPTFRGFRE